MVFLRNERGQAFSAFKLLIAAIIAMAILGILMTVINSIGQIGTEADPTEQAAELVGELRDRGGYEKSDVVTFGADKKTMRSSEIIAAAEVGMAPDQICLSLGDFSETDDFEAGQENGSPQLIAFNRGGSRDVELSVLCNAGDLIEADIEEIGEYEGLEEEWTDDCDFEGRDEMCCLIALRKR